MNTHEQLREEWENHVSTFTYPREDMRFGEDIADFWISKLDTYADAKLTEVAEEIENLSNSPEQFSTIGKEERNKVYNQSLSDAASLVRSKMNKKV